MTGFVGATVIGSFKNIAASGFLGTLVMTATGTTAEAQAADDLDASVSTIASAALSCGQNLSWGRVYVAPSNSLSSVHISLFGTLFSTHPSVVLTGATVGQCTLSGLQGADTATITIAGASGTSVTGGLTGVTLLDGASHTLTAAVQVGGSGSAVSGGRTGVSNGIITLFGVVVIPASHVDFGTYTATITATAALN